VTQPPDVKWAEAARDLQFTSLGDIRTTAGNWRNALLALTGLFAAVTIVKGTDATSDLSHAGLVATAALAAATLLLLVVGSLAAGVAAYGLPGPAEFVSGERLKAWTENEARRARWQLYAAMGCFIVAIATLAAAIGVTWFDGGKSAPAPSVVVDLTAGGSVCGAVKSIGTGGIVVTVKDKYGNDYDRTIPLARIATIAAAASC
jgi:hypothetical protein